MISLNSLKIFKNFRSVSGETPKLTLEKVNNLPIAEFHQIFANVIELWPQAAIYCSALAPFRTVQQLIDSFQNYLSVIPADDKLKILRHHPDLAGKMAEAGELTEESSFEQASAKLHQLDAQNRQNLNELNDEYKAKFGFPFIICVREAKKVEVILKAMRDRINNSVDAEVRTGIEEVKKICRLRILQIVNE